MDCHIGSQKHMSETLKKRVLYIYSVYYIKERKRKKKKWSNTKEGGRETKTLWNITERDKQYECKGWMII